MNCSHVLLALGLPLLLVAGGCGQKTRAAECATLAEAANARLERVEALYRAAPEEKVKWKEISQLYSSLADDLKTRKFEDGRLVPMVNEYILILGMAARNAQTAADELKDGPRGSFRHFLSLLRQQSEQHSRLSARIDRLCRSQ